MVDFTVQDWMNDLIVFIDPDKTVDEALALMRRRYIHSLIVNKTEKNPEYGIITSTDISDKIIAQNQNPAKVTVSEIMNTPLLTVDKQKTIQDCSLLMKKYQIHHLPVMDENGNLVGMISASDFLVVAEAMGRAPGEQIV
jgi:signal-transduction protein with cAMP-binding, CBS, and nucleotidyltransferase domain